MKSKSSGYSDKTQVNMRRGHPYPPHSGRGIRMPNTEIKFVYFGIRAHRGSVKRNREFPPESHDTFPSDRKDLTTRRVRKYPPAPTAPEGGTLFATTMLSNSEPIRSGLIRRAAADIQRLRRSAAEVPPHPKLANFGNIYAADGEIFRN